MGARHLLARGAPATLITTLSLIAVPLNASAAAPPASINAQHIAAAAPAKSKVTLASLQDKLAAAKQRHESAAAAEKAARSAAEKAKTEASAAQKRMQQAQRKLDDFVAASYQQGTPVGSVASYVGSTSPANMLDRASLLNAVGEKQLDVVDSLKETVDKKAELDTAAAAALREADANKKEAAKAKADAEAAAEAAAAESAERNEPQESEAAPKASTSADVVVPAQGRLTSTFGPRGGTAHNGIDIANSIGTPIVSAMDGEVVDSGPASGFGLWVRVQHANGLITVYGHINESMVSVGQQVSAGEQIATIGNRGQSTGPHLHFEVHQGGTKIDPLAWLNGHGISL
jgi:murein DD-endopeptidase MepM/ murein hydrolase activator NlpD